MPVRLNELVAKHQVCEISNKAELLKLVNKHSAGDADTAELAELVDDIAKLPDNTSSRPKYVKLHAKLQREFTEFKKLYGKKHPRFCKAFEEVFIAPLEMVVAGAPDPAVAMSALTDALQDCAETCDDIVAGLAGPIDDAALLRLLGKMNVASGSHMIALRNAKELDEWNDIEVMRRIQSIGDRMPHKLESCKKIIMKMREAQNYAVPLAGVSDVFKDLKKECELFQKMLADSN